MEKVVVSITLFQPSVSNYPIDLFHKLVKRFLYHGNSDLNGKVDDWLR